MATWTSTGSNEANLMKIKYHKLIEKQFNMANVIFGRIKKIEDFVGSDLQMAVQQSIGGGVGCGTSLPTSNINKISKALLGAPKNMYGVVSIDRKSKKLSSKSEGAFVKFTAFPVKTAVKSFNRNLERMLTRNTVGGSGALITGGAGDTNVSGDGTSGDPFIVSFDTASTYFPAEFECIEVGDILNADAEATALVVSDMSVSVANGYATGTITLVGSSVLLAADEDTTPFVQSLYMQNSKDAEIVGIQGAISATSSTLHNISIGHRWQAYQKNASSASLSTDLMNDVVLNVKRQSSESPSMILTSYHQFVKLLNLLEDQKRYQLPARDKKYKGQVSFAALEYMSADGPIPVIPSRFIDSDKMYFLNERHIELHLCPGGFEWFQDDGTVFLREASVDSYEARYGGYGQSFINPAFQGYLYGLAV